MKTTVSQGHRKVAESITLTTYVIIWHIFHGIKFFVFP